ncbi:MAG TPA: TenA family protein [Actinomycetota bacterium]|nr:TenA family protein [Actinomycetota bacterium]
MTRGVASILHQAGGDTWRNAVEHPMVREIAAGTLPHETFRGYFRQNVLYLEDYARAIGLLLAGAPDRAALDVLTRFEVQIVRTEIPANLAFLERLGGDEDTLAGRGKMLPTTYAYTKHLLAVCATQDVAAGLAAVLPCQWSYGELAKPLMRARPADPIYADWIGLFGDEGYDALVGETTGLLDRLVDPADGRRLHELARIFERSIAYERAFWEMAYGSDGSPNGGGHT